MGALKILKRLEAESILKSKKIGKAAIYRINMNSFYARRYLSLILSRESLHAPSHIKRWIEELKKIKNAEVVILFGSVLEKLTSKDIDVLLITDQKLFPKLQQEIKSLNEMNVKKIHPLYQAYNDVIKNIKKKDKPLLNAIKGIVVGGEEKILDIYNESRQE